MEKIFFVSLGCDKNLVDSEQMIGCLAHKGYLFTEDETEADAIIINSCCFIGDAKEESINRIIELGELKKTGKLRALIVCGCLAQRYSEEIKQELPEVDALVGTTAFDDILSAVEEALAGKGIARIKDINRLSYMPENRVVTTGGHYAYLKIAEGCDKRCTYCVIPSIRGSFRSVPMEKLIEEAGQLAELGVKELILVAQETTVYGTDLYGKKSLPELLKKLCQIPGIAWVRLLYCYPEEIDDELIAVIRDEKKICHYLDLPIQSGSDEILRRMGRRIDSERIKALVEKLRSEIPDIALRTTLITGFPGETDEEHTQTMEFINELEFDRLGAFKYSAEEGTYAAGLAEQIPDEVMEDRLAEIMELQQEIAFEKAEEKVGRELLVMIEGKAVDEEVYVARSYMDAPGVDGLVFVNTDIELMTGDFARVKVTGAYEYDLIAELV